MNKTDAEEHFKRLGNAYQEITECVRLPYAVPGDRLRKPNYDVRSICSHLASGSKDPNFHSSQSKTSEPKHYARAKCESIHEEFLKDKEVKESHFFEFALRVRLTTNSVLWLWKWTLDDLGNL